jgi:hypothetical protein
LTPNLLKELGLRLAYLLTATVSHTKSDTSQSLWFGKFEQLGAFLADPRPEQI